jgi:hypothetical protein
MNKPWQEQRTRVLDVRVTQRGVDLYHADFHDYRTMHTAPPRVDPDGLEAPIRPSGPVCDAELPRAIRVRAADADQDVEFAYRDAKWNPPLISGAFSLTVPAGTRQTLATCGEDGASAHAP